jgi:hypothetical protein
MSSLAGQPLLDNPLDEPLFVNRDGELQEGLGAAERGINVLVSAPRGGGKTSFLHRLERDLRLQGVEPAYIAGHALAQSATDLLGDIRYRLTEPRTENINLIPDFASLLNPRTRQVMPAGERMLRELGSLRTALEQRGQRAAVLLDEMPNREEARSLFARLRDEVWRLPLVWIVATNESDVETFLKPPADAFFGRIIKLAPFSQANAQRLLELRVPDMDTRTRETLAEQAGGNPRRLISLAQDVVVRGQSPQHLAENARGLRERLAELGEPAQRLYAELEALGQASASDPYLLERLGWKRARAQQVLAKLEQAGLVVTSQEVQDRGGPKKVYRPNREDLQ